MGSSAGSGVFELELLSPARLSLFLRIARRDDGFHDSASLFQTVDLGDRLRLARIPGDEVAAAGVVRPSRKSEPIKQNVEFSTSPAGIADLPVDQTNMVVRALTLYRKKLAERDGGSFAVPRFRAHLVKELPIDAGLGGAASNAATALLGANELCGGLASPEELRAWATELEPSVVPFLGGSGSAFCTGRAIFLRGDEVEPLPPLASDDTDADADPDEADDALELFVVAPAVELSTPALFRRLAADGDSGAPPPLPPAELLGAFAAMEEGAQPSGGARSSGGSGGGGGGSGGSSGGVGGDSAGHSLQLPDDPALYVNDLEAAALASCAPLAAVRAALLGREGFRVAAMSGAGPALFALGRPQGGGGGGGGGETANAFAARFAEEISAEAGVAVRVWPVRLARGPAPSL